MDSVNAQAEAGKHLVNFLGRSVKAFKTNWGKQLVGYSAVPLTIQKQLAERRNFSTYKKISESKKDEKKEEPGLLQRVRDTVVEKFAVGDLISAAGLFLYCLQNKIGPEKPGLVGGLLKNATLLMTLLGSTSAAVGRSLGFEKEVIYGEEQARQMLEEAENSGKKIFSVYEGNDTDVQKLITKAKRLDKTLIYKHGLWQSILERHEQGQIGGIFDGPAGTGKTAGVECILGKWADKVRREGDIPVIAELNLKNFDKYVQEQKHKQRDAIEFFETWLETQGNNKGTYATNQGLMVLELLIRQIQDLRDNVKAYNDNNEGPKKKLAVFADEFDKALQANTLKGCDKTRLRNLLIQFNELFVDEDILLTSNTKLEDLMQELAEHVKIDDANTGQEEVLRPMYDRLSAKNRALIEAPAAKEQALIVSGRALLDYEKHIDWNDFGGELARTGNFEYDRKQFAEIIEREITSKLRTRINGRQLDNACKQLQSMLLGKAREINAEKRIFDDKAWAKMSAENKINYTGAKIDKAMLTQVVEDKVQNMNLNQDQQDLELGVDLVDAYMRTKAASKFLKDKRVKLNAASVNLSNFDNVLAGVYEKRLSSSGNVIYVAKEPVEHAGKKYLHLISQYPKEGATSVAFAELGAKSVPELDMYDFLVTKRISQTKFAKDVIPMINSAAESKLMKAVDGLVNNFVGNLAKGKPVNLNSLDADQERLIKDATSSVLSNIFNADLAA